MLSQLINTAEQTTIHLDALRLDGGTQPRDGLNAAYVDELAQALQNGATLPPVDVMHDGQNYWLYDGYHRVAAHRQANYLLIPARIHQGNQTDAQWESYAANKSHGLRRSPGDKERAIRAALKHPNGAKLSDSLIARHLDVSDKTVTRYREIMESASEIPKVTERQGADGKTYNTTNIGAKPAPVAATRPTPNAGLAALITRYVRQHFGSRDEALKFLINRSDYSLTCFEQSARAQGVACDQDGLRLAVDAAITLTMQTADWQQPAPAAEPWDAAWTKLHPNEYPDEQRNRLSEAMIPWALAWKDNGRTWRDVVDRNPQHANSPFRQAAETECRRRGLDVEGHHMQDVIRKLFFRLINTNPIMAAPTPDPEASAPGAPTAPALTDADFAVMAELRAEVDGAEEAAQSPISQSPISQSPNLPVSLRNDYDSDEWYTPAEIIEAARRAMDGIALDPATCELAQTVVQADAWLTKADDGLAHQRWLGRTIWLNPPYSDTQRWVDKLLSEFNTGLFIQHAIILVNNATETTWFQSLLTHSAVVCFPARRLAFWRHDHSNIGARQGQAIFYLGANVAAFIHEFESFGIILRRVA